MADEDIPYSDAPDASPRVMPDQQAASGQPYGGGPSPASLLNAIGSMGGGAVPPPAMMAMGGGGGLGGLPPEAILGLLAAPPSQGMGYAQALAGGVSAMRNQPNPVSAIMDQQTSRQFGITQILQRMQTDDRIRQHEAAQMDLARKKLVLEEQNKKDDLQLRTREQDRRDTTQGLVFLKEMKDNPNPLAREAYTKGMSALSGKYGQPVPPEFFVQQMKIDDKELDHIRGAIESGATDEQIVTRFPKVATVPDYLATERAILNNPAMRAKLGYKTDEELREIQYKAVTAKAQAWALENGFKVDSPEFRYANAAFREATGGKNIYDADPSSAPDLMAITQARAQGEKQALARMEEQKRMEAGLHREMADYNNKLTEARQEARDIRTEARQGSKPLPGTWIDMQTGLLVTPTQEEYTVGGGSKRYRNSNTQEENLLARLSTVQAMSTQIKNLINGLLVDNTPDNLVNALKGRGARALRNSAGWAQLDNLLTERNIELTGALGPGQFRTTLMTYLQDAGVKTRDTREVANIVGDAIDTSVQNRRMSIISGGNQAAMQAYQNPLAPKSPAVGSKLIDGNWISESGKYIWRNGQWTPLP